LDLSNNQITEIPAEISMMTSLNKLNMTNNQLKDVPVEMGQLKSLTEFDYAGNQFTLQTQKKIIKLLTPPTAKPKKSSVYKKPVSKKKKPAKRK
jgi:Leucine-rich repeat (LRR) protein